MKNWIKIIEYYYYSNNRKKFNLNFYRILESNKKYSQNEKINFLEFILITFITLKYYYVFERI
jgi:hypothetical protein